MTNHFKMLTLNGPIAGFPITKFQSLAVYRISPQLSLPLVDSFEERCKRFWITSYPPQEGKKMNIEVEGSIWVVMAKTGRILAINTSHGKAYAFPWDYTEQGLKLYQPLLFTRNPQMREEGQPSIPFGIIAKPDFGFAIEVNGELEYSVNLSGARDPFVERGGVSLQRFICSSARELQMKTIIFQASSWM